MIKSIKIILETLCIMFTAVFAITGIGMIIAKESFKNIFKGEDKNE